MRHQSGQPLSDVGPQTVAATRLTFGQTCWALLGALAFLLALLPAVVPPVRAAAALDFTVDSLADEPDAGAAPDGLCVSAPSGKCTLRAAVREIEAGGFGIIRLPAGQITLTLGQFTTTKSYVILGASSSGAGTILDGNNQSRILDIDASSFVYVENVTIQNGKAGIGVAGHFHGGGIHNHGRLIMVNSAIINNRVTAPAWGGGGLTNATTGIAKLVNVTISGNQVTNTNGQGGGIENLGKLGFPNPSAPGGIDPGLVHVTLFHNTAPTAGGNYWNAAMNGLKLQNTLIAGTTLAEGGNCASAFTPGYTFSAGYNLADDNVCSGDLSAMTDKNNADPKLGPLQNNGGPTPTHALLAGSAAQNAIPVGANCPADPYAKTDQRGVARPFAARCDIGAFEVGAPPALASLSPNVAGDKGPSFTLTVTGTNFLGSPGSGPSAAGQAVSVVLWNGQPRPTTYVSPTELRAQIPASDLAALGTATVQVETPTVPASPSPDGGKTAGLPFQIKRFLHLPLVS